MQFICFGFHCQNLKFYHKVCYILFSLLKGFDLLFDICCLALVTESSLDFSYKFTLILGSCFFVQLIKLLLGINPSYTLSKISKDHCDPIIYFYDLVTLEEQSYFPPLIFKSCPILIKPSWIQNHILRQFCLYIVLIYQYC